MENESKVDVSEKLNTRLVTSSFEMAQSNPSNSRLLFKFLLEAVSWVRSQAEQNKDSMPSWVCKTLKPLKKFMDSCTEDLDESEKECIRVYLGEMLASFEECGHVTKKIKLNDSKSKSPEMSIGAQPVKPLSEAIFATLKYTQSFCRKDEKTNEYSCVVKFLGMERGEVDQVQLRTKDWRKVLKRDSISKNKKSLLKQDETEVYRCKVSADESATSTGNWCLIVIWKNPKRELSHVKLPLVWTFDPKHQTVCLSHACSQRYTSIDFTVSDKQGLEVISLSQASQASITKLISDFEPFQNNGNHFAKLLKHEDVPSKEWFSDWATLYQSIKI